MASSRIALVVAITLLAASAVFSQDAQKEPAPISEQPTIAAAASPVPTSLPSYPDTAQGLEKQMKDIVKLEKQGKQQELAAYIRSMALPDANNWFKSVFGDLKGEALASASERGRKEF
ncbi:MAG: hypothetical protein WCD43_05685 [Candidatus Acidiferrales bacterium]